MEIAPTEIEGFSMEEIASVEKRLDKKFPSAYRNFLAVIGRRLGRIGFYESLFLGDLKILIELQKFPGELFAETPTSFVLPQDALVISQHDGYQFIYFRVGENQDPPVFFYIEGSNESQLASISFSKYLRVILENHRCYYDYQVLMPHHRARIVDF